MYELTPRNVTVCTIPLPDRAEVFTVAGRLHLTRDRAERAAKLIRISRREREGN